MEKLVRDGVPEFLKEQGTHVTYKQAHEADRTGLLYAKLLEEIGELLTARDDEQKLKELGDLQEVIWALGEVNGITSEQILLQALKKQNLRGGFEELHVLGIELGPDPSESPSKPSSRPEANWPGGRVPDVIAHGSYAYSG